MPSEKTEGRATVIDTATTASATPPALRGSQGNGDQRDDESASWMGFPRLAILRAIATIVSLSILSAGLVLTGPAAGSGTAGPALAEYCETAVNESVGPQLKALEERMKSVEGHVAAHGPGHGAEPPHLSCLCRALPPSVLPPIRCNIAPYCTPTEERECERKYRGYMCVGLHSIYH